MDATVAGLGWPLNSNRGTLSTHPDASTIEAPAHTTSTPSASLEAMTTPNDPGTTTPVGHILSSASTCRTFPDKRIAQLSTLFVTRVSPHEWFTKFTSRSLLTQTTPGSYSLKRYRPREFPNVVIPNTIFTLSPAIGSGLCELQTIGAIILRFLYYTGTILFTMSPLRRPLLQMKLALPPGSRIWPNNYQIH